MSRNRIIIIATAAASLLLLLIPGVVAAGRLNWSDRAVKTDVLPIEW